MVRGSTATRLLAGLTAVVLAAAALQVAALGTRGTAGIWGASPSGAEGRPEGAVVVLVLNTQDSVGAAELTDLVLDRQADVVVLPETDSGTAAEVVRLGDYRTITPRPARLATFTARPGSPDGAPSRPGPPITAVHAFPPLPGTLADWRAEGTAVVLACEDEPGAIVAGDLNTTLDHPAFDHLDRCVDATAEAEAAGVGTWPASRPRALGAPIDHVLVDGAAWTVHSATGLEPPPGTDHRAVEAVLLPRA